MGDLWFITDVDTEFDCLRPGYQRNYKINNPGLTKGVTELSNFFYERNIHSTFHMQEQKDSSFSILEKYPEVYKIIEEHDQEISLHLHLKEEEYEPRKQEFISAINRLKEHGYSVSSFKAGWYFTNEYTIKILEEFNIQYDCSPYKHLAIGPMQWYTIPDSPYFPSYENITKPGSAHVLMIPITSKRLCISIHRDNDHEFTLMKKGIRALIQASEKTETPVIIYFSTHSWKPIETNSSSLRKWEQKRRKQFFDFLFQFPIRSLSVKEAGALWKKGNYKPYWLRLPDHLKNFIPVYRPTHYRWLARYIDPFIQRYQYRKSTVDFFTK